MKKRDKQIEFFTDHVKRCERKMHADDSTCIIDVVIFLLVDSSGTSIRA